MFRTVHAINIQGRPAQDYIWMNELDETKGLDIGDRYTTNVNKCHDSASAIADVQCTTIRENFEHCKFVSFIVDGSIDSSITDNEMVYMQTCLAGVACTKFIYCCQVQCGSAPRIVKLYIDLLEL